MMSIKSGSKNRGLLKVMIAGISNKALIRQEKIEIVTNPPKKRRGAKLENNSTENPTITETALITIPLPAVFKVFVIANLLFPDNAYSLLYRHKK